MPAIDSGVRPCNVAPTHPNIMITYVISVLPTPRRAPPYAARNGRLVLDVAPRIRPDPSPPEGKRGSFAGALTVVTGSPTEPYGLLAAGTADERGAQGPVTAGVRRRTPARPAALGVGGDVPGGNVPTVGACLGWPRDRFGLRGAGGTRCHLDPLRILIQRLQVRATPA
jgi:hypothetical protein